ncbi:ankyrin repeat domain-containing protein [Verticillium alfalfae VaMs.102]|uniref:Ankyrin repeat domain-containing protein n=1 Tax=Verticillium alfalfae (strain VaMs.102 / ATCC MYA-4576 / FGSC 10136) TaxID=526221 RepID=C9SGJ8_VERA1|nr:ankyrin repeat domain-containing protein [Verticillium alfalfae VaMs.102]EEY17515.1 ankyrin repeat domain-containing protein [Verticillium alfalfae VaMs.102]
MRRQVDKNRRPEGIEASATPSRRRSRLLTLLSRRNQTSHQNGSFAQEPPSTVTIDQVSTDMSTKLTQIGGSTVVKQGDNLQDTLSPESLESCASSSSPSLWDVAYDALRDDNDESKQRVEKYEKILSSKLQATHLDPPVGVSGDVDAHRIDVNTVDNAITSDQSSRRRQMTRITELGLEKRDSEQIKFHIGETEINVGDQVKKGLSFIQWAQGWVGQAVALSPEASVAWAVVSLALPLLTNPISTTEAHENGYEKVTSLMQYYVAQETHLLGINKGTNQSATNDRSSDKGTHSEITAQIAELRKRIIELYKAILDFQIQSVLRFYRNRLKLFAVDALCLTDWAALTQAVESREVDVKELNQCILSAKTNHSLELMREEAIEVQKKWHIHLSALEGLSKDNLATSKEILVVSSQNGETAKQQLASSERVEATLKELHNMAIKLVSDKSVEKTELMRLFAEQVSYDAGPEKTKDRIVSMVGGTGRWLLESDSFHACLNHKSGLHLATGLPGCGKSVISRYLIDTVLPGRGFTTTCYFFFDQHSTAQALCSMLHQVFTQHEVLIHHAFDEYERRGKTIVHNSAVLWQILEAVAGDPEAGRMALVIDALDQCKDDQIGDFILDHHRTDGSLPLFVTTRPYDYIINGFEDGDETGIFKTRGDDEQATALITAEVEKVVEQRISKLRWPERMKQRLKERMLQVKNPTYLWIRLIFDALEPRRGRASRGFLPTSQNIDKLLSELPQDFNEAYDQILSTTANQGLMRTAMSLIIAAQRPLKVREMSVAMQLSSSTSSLNALLDDLLDDSQFEDALKQWCGLFIIIQDSSIYLLHETGREFFTRPPPAHPLKALTWQGSISLEEAHMTTVKICIWALSQQDLLSSTGQPVLLKTEGLPLEELINQTTYTLNQFYNTTYPFIIYASLYWPIHVRESGKLPMELETLYNSLTEPSNDLCQAWFGLYAFNCHLPIILQQIDRSSLRTLLGHRRQVLKDVEEDPKLLIPVSKNSDRQGFNQPLPLILAAMMAHDVDMVKALLQVGADPNDSFGPEAPLPWLIHECPPSMLCLVPLLLQSGAMTTPVVFEDWTGRTPVYAAARKGLYETVNILLEHESCTGVSSTASLANYGETPLHVVTDVATMKVLLQHGADPLALDEAGRTPLETCKGYELRRLLFEACHAEIDEKYVREALDTATSPEEVALFFAYGAKPSLRNNNGGVPQFTNWALNVTASRSEQTEQRGILREYLKHCDLEFRDDTGNTPLLHYASRGIAVVLQELLTCGAVTDARDHEGRTALHHLCSGNSHPEWGNPQQRALGMRYLRDALKDDALLHATDSQEQTALHRACRWTDEQMIRLLVDSGLSVEAVDKKGRTPLMHAIGSHNAVHNVPILHRCGARMDVCDGSGLSVFHLLFAGEDSAYSDGIVRVLAARMDINIADQDGRTPLMHAVGRNFNWST